MSKSENYQQIRCELVQRPRFGFKILSRLDIDLELEQSPDTCKGIAQRLPFEMGCQSKFYGVPIIQEGIYLLEGVLPMWRKFDKNELKDMEPEPGCLYMGYHAPYSDNNPKQATVRFTLERFSW